MYVIVSTGGKQYKVTKGDVIDVEKLDVEPGKTVELDVLMFSDDKKVVVDADELAKMKVTATVVDQHKGDQVLVFKFKKRKRYSLKKGHRQNLTRLEVTALPGEKAAAKKASTKAAAKADDAVAEEKPAKKAPAKKADGEKKPAAKKTTAKKAEKKSE